MPQKIRIHNEWFRSISKRSCPCGAKKVEVWSWGEYRNCQWTTIEHFCEKCFEPIRNRLVEHAKPCGCVFELNGYGGQKLPEWLAFKGDELMVYTFRFEYVAEGNDWREAAKALIKEITDDADFSLLSGTPDIYDEEQKYITTVDLEQINE